MVIDRDQNIYQLKKVVELWERLLEAENIFYQGSGLCLGSFQKEDSNTGKERKSE